MTCITKITPTSNTLKNLVVDNFFHSYYIQRDFNANKEIIVSMFSAYIESLLKYINHPAFIQ